MKTTRTVTIVTANLGRGVSVREFKKNVDRIKDGVPGKHIFFQPQEIDEADAPEEMRYLRRLFSDSHRFVGVKTAVPILVPKTFEIDRRIIKHASDGVAGLSPRRYVVQALVHPVDHPDCKVLPTNTHFGRNVPQLALPRESAEQVLRARLRTSHASWLTADLNSRNYPTLAPNERKWISANLDYIRGYVRKGVKMQLIGNGSINLTIDGHDAHWAKVRIVWS